MVVREQKKYIQLNTQTMNIIRSGKCIDITLDPPKINVL